MQHCPAFQVANDVSGLRRLRGSYYLGVRHDRPELTPSEAKNIVDQSLYYAAARADEKSSNGPMGPVASFYASVIPYNN